MSSLPLRFLLLTVAGWMTRDQQRGTRRFSARSRVGTLRHEAWMLQIGRNLTDVVDGFLLKHRYVIMDRDPLYTHAFRAMFAASGVRSVRLPPKSPNLNAHAERWIGSVWRECLARVILLGECHLRQVPREFTAHYHAERNHQSLGNELIEHPNNNAAASGCVQRRKRLGGVLSYYYREAA